MGADPSGPTSGVLDLMSLGRLSEPDAGTSKQETGGEASGRAEGLKVSASWWNRSSDAPLGKLL